MTYQRGAWVTSHTFNMRAQVTGQREIVNGRDYIGLTLHYTNYAGDEATAEFWWWEDDLLPLAHDDAPQQMTLFEQVTS